MPLFLALLQAEPDAGGALGVAVVGITVVFVVLSTIGGVIALLGRLLAPPAPEATPAPVPAASGAAGLAPETLAVLTAAAYAAVGQPVRVRRVTFIEEDTVSAWTDAGRARVQGSHNFRRTY